MLRWTTFVALLLVMLFATSSLASVAYKGLAVSGTGQCVFDVDATGHLLLQNIGSSGQDGVSFSCTHMDGMRLQLDGSVSSADAGGDGTLTYRWALASAPAGSQARAATVRWHATPAGLELSADLSGLTSNPLYTLTLKRRATVIYGGGWDGQIAVRASLGASGMCPLPAMAVRIVRDRDSGRSKGMSARLDFPSVVSVSVAGQLFDCDDVELSCAVPVAGPDDDCDGRSCDFTVTSPPGSSLSQVRCSDGSCRVLGHEISATGVALISLDHAAALAAPQRLSVSNIGSSGEDGVEVKWKTRSLSPGSGGGGGAGGENLDGPCAMLRYAPPGLYFDPAVDEGAASVMTISGRAFSSSGADLGPASASLSLTMTGQNFYAIPAHTGGGATQEWVAVLSGGVEVGRAQLAAGHGVHVIAPPAEPLGVAINEKGLPDEKVVKKGTQGGKSPNFGAQPAAAASSSSSGLRGGAIELRCPLHVSFAAPRLFDIDGVQLTGDDIECFSDDGSGALSGTFAAYFSREKLKSTSGSSRLSTMQLLDISPSGGDPIGPVTSSVSLSSAHTCVTVPFTFTRSATTPVRGFSATLHLSPELALCGAGVTEGDYLSRVAGTQMFVTDNGGGSYTVDCSILGPVCGATGDGTLFSLALSATQPLSGAVGVVTMDAVTVRDCSNQPVAADPGAPGFIPIEFAAPPALTGLTATTQKSGNAPGMIAAIVVACAAPPASSPPVAVAFYRKGFGNHPYYDNAPNAGAVPSPPVSPAAALANGWTRATCGTGTCSNGVCTSTCTATSVVDVPSSRDFYYYVAFARDLYGNESPVSSMTSGTLDYFLGDVTDGSTACSGDDHVNLADVSLLGAHYGSSVSVGSSYACLDVGPTTDFSVDGRPTTDGRVNFEDFMMFAINYSVVSAPHAAARQAAMAGNAAWLLMPTSLPAVGGTFDVAIECDGAGDAQGVSARLDFDPAVVEQVGVANGALLDAQGRAGAVLSSGPGDVDALLLGAGPGIAGRGELARLTFRVKAGGDARFALAGLSARDVSNHPVPVAGADAGAVADARTGLGVLFPNPFRNTVEIRMSLRRDGAARLAVFDVAGRRVRVLMDGVQPAGARTLEWDGTDDAGVRMAPGAYVLRLEANGRNETRTVRLVR